MRTRWKNVIGLLLLPAAIVALVQAGPVLRRLICQAGRLGPAVERLLDGLLDVLDSAAHPPAEIAALWVLSATVLGLFILHRKG